MATTTDTPHFCWYGRHPECDAETDRLAEMEAPAFRCNVCGFTSPTAEADALHWTLAVEADELHGGGDHLDAEAEHADRQIGDRAFTAEAERDDCGGGFCPECGADHDAAQAVCDDCAGYTDDPYLPEGMR